MPSGSRDDLPAPAPVLDLLIRSIAGEIDPRIELLEHAATEHRHIQMRCLRILSGPGTRPGLMVSNSQLPFSAVPMRPKPRNPGSSDFCCASSGWLYLPSEFACHISIMASGTASPLPSSTRTVSRTRSPLTCGPAMQRTLHLSRRETEMKKRTDGLRGCGHQIHIRSRRAWPPDRAHTMSNLYPVAHCGCVVSRSKREIIRCRAFSSGID